MERRQVLHVLALGSIGTALGQTPAWAAEIGQPWGYGGETGPDHWGDLSPEFQVCGLGQAQSPIDLHHPVPATLSPITLNYHPVPLTLLNNGHTIQVMIDGDARGGNTLDLEGKRYTLRQFHFHHPSEHTVAGSVFPMELHLVHTHDDGSIVVLGVLIQAGRENPHLTPIWNAMPAHVSKAQTVPNVRMNPHDLLPPEGDTFRYFGSLTTPPCSEMVSWLVFQRPIQASRSQMDQFAQIFPNNARPVQPQNHRLVLESHRGEDMG